MVVKKLKKINKVVDMVSLGCILWANAKVVSTPPQ
jgi:hypothetical protein